MARSSTTYSEQWKAQGHENRQLENQKRAKAALARRILAQRQLIYSVKQFDPTYKDGWVHHDICERLDRFRQQVALRQSPRLMLFCPPRIGKSRLASIEFPAHALGNHPSWEIIAASYSESLPLGFSRKIRTRITDRNYQAIFKDTRLDKDNKAAQGWMTSQGGGYTPSGTSGGITGKGAHCLPAGTMVQTEIGPVDIAHLYQLKYLPRVWSWDAQQNKAVLRRILATHVRDASNLYEVRTVGGKVIRATGEHPVLDPVTGQYVRVDRLSAGDRIGTSPSFNRPHLHELRESIPAGPVQPQQIPKTRLHGFLLLQSLQPGTSCGEEPKEVCYVWRTSEVQAQEPSSEILLSQVRRFSATGPDTETVPTMRGEFHTAESRSGLLQSRLRGGSPCQTYAGEGESTLQGWDQLCKMVQGYETTDLGAGPAPVCCLRDRGSASCTPHRPQYAEQSGGEPDYIVQNAPHGSPQVDRDTVSMVTPVGGEPVRVYDLQIERTNNFLADEVWVHNCLIIDDPLKNAEEADSETIRDSIWDWYGTTAKTRLAPGGGVLVILTRWHFDDLAGRLLEQDKEQQKEVLALIEASREQAAETSDAGLKAQLERDTKELEEEYKALDHWEVIEYPALATEYESLHIPSRQIVRTAEPINDSEHRQLRAPGDALHPARYPRARLLNMKRTMQPRHWSALYQQKPTPDEGNYFSKAGFKYEAVPPPIDEMFVVCAWDLAVGEKKANDYTVGVVVGLDYQGYWHVIHMVRGRWADMEKVADIVIDTHTQYRARMTGIEHGQLSLALGPSLNKRLRERTEAGEKVSLVLAEGDDALKPINDKDFRARPLQGRMQQGMVYFPTPESTPWMEDLMTELLRFPNGVHDDCVDGLSWAGRLLIGRKPPANPHKTRTVKQHKGWRDKLNERLAMQGRGKGHMAA